MGFKEREKCIKTLLDKFERHNGLEPEISEKKMNRTKTAPIINYFLQILAHTVCTNRIYISKYILVFAKFTFAFHLCIYLERKLLAQKSKKSNSLEKIKDLIIYPWINIYYLLYIICVFIPPPFILKSLITKALIILNPIVFGISGENIIIGLHDKGLNYTKNCPK